VILLVKFVSKKLSIFQAVLLQIVLEIHVSLGNLAKALNKREHVVLPNAYDSLVGREVRLSTLPVLFALFPEPREKEGVPLIHEHALSIHFVLLEHADVALHELVVFELAKPVVLAVPKLAYVLQRARC